MNTKKFAAIAAATLGATLMMGGCGSGNGGGGEEPTTSEESAGSDNSFIYVTNTPIGINKFLESGKIGIDLAAETYGGTSKTFEGSNEEANRANIEAAVAEAPDVIVLITFDFEDLSKEFAEANPDQEFLLIDSCPADGPANLHCAVFREQEASYLLGAEAGLLSETGKVGSVGAVDIPFIHRYTDSFALGAKSTNPDATDTQVFIGGSNPFGDPAKGKEQALSLAATGVDHMFAAASGSNGGIFEAASEKGLTAYGVDVNQCPDVPGAVGDGTIKAVDVLVVKEIGKILDGTAEPVTSYGLEEGGMDIVSLTEDAADSQCTVMEHPEVVEQLAELKEQIIAGEVDIPDPVTS